MGGSVDSWWRAPTGRMVHGCAERHSRKGPADVPRGEFQSTDSSSRQRTKGAPLTDELLHRRWQWPTRSDKMYPSSSTGCGSAGKSPARSRRIHQGPKLMLCPCTKATTLISKAQTPALKEDQLGPSPGSTHMQRQSPLWPVGVQRQQLRPRRLVAISMLLSTLLTDISSTSTSKTELTLLSTRAIRITLLRPATMDNTRRSRTISTEPLLLKMSTPPMTEKRLPHPRALSHRGKQCQQAAASLLLKLPSSTTRAGLPLPSRATISWAAGQQATKHQ